MSEKIEKPDLGSAFLVIRRGALIGTTSELDEAIEMAEEAGGRVAQLPIVADCRGSRPLVNINGKCEHDVDWDTMEPVHYQWYHHEESY